MFQGLGFGDLGFSVQSSRFLGFGDQAEFRIQELGCRASVFTLPIGAIQKEHGD